MNEFEHAVAVESCRSNGHSRAAVFLRGSELVAVVADGVGGAAVADLVVEHVRQIVDRGMNLKTPGLWRQVLLEASLAAEAVGQSTGLVVGPGFGASVGDSRAWLIKPDRMIDLTAQQPRKPLLGGGFAEPSTFSVAMEYGDALLLATAGLFKNVGAPRICDLVRLPTLLPEQLVQAAKLPSGALQDDVGVVLLRRSRSASDGALREAVAAGDGSESAVRRLQGLLERWIENALIDQNLCSDGVTVGVIRPDCVAGVMWRMEKQTQDPFEMHLRPDGIELLFGDATFPQGLRSGAKRLTVGRTREWAFRRFVPAGH